MIKVGPAGSDGLGNLKGVQKAAEVGLDCMEVEFTYGVRMNLETAKDADQRPFNQRAARLERRLHLLRQVDREDQLRFPECGNFGRLSLLLDRLSAGEEPETDGSLPVLVEVELRVEAADGEGELSGYGDTGQRDVVDETQPCQVETPPEPGLHHRELDSRVAKDQVGGRQRGQESTSIPTIGSRLRPTPRRCHASTTPNATSTTSSLMAMKRPMPTTATFNFSLASYDRADPADPRIIQPAAGQVAC